MEKEKLIKLARDLREFGIGRGASDFGKFIEKFREKYGHSQFYAFDMCVQEKYGNLGCLFIATYFETDW